jgi:hypothetical protein
VKSPLCLEGNWQERLAELPDVIDSVITDPPYSARTHDASDDLPEGRQAFAYEPLTPEGACEIVDAFAPRVRHWLGIMTDDTLAPVFRARFAACGLYDFAPVPIILPNGLRIQGDGPCSGCVWFMVARPKTRKAQKWRSLCGYYEAPRVKVKGVLGAKDIGLMVRVVEDYSNAGHLVVDPYGGRFSTAIACVKRGRRCVTIERDPDTFKLGRAELDAALAIVDVEARQTHALFRDEVRAEGKRARRAKPITLFPAEAMTPKPGAVS